MEKVKSYVAFFAVAYAAALAALKTYEVLNKPKVAPPSTAPVSPPVPH